MKNLKFKSTLFSLMAIAMLTVFLTSCEEDKLPLPTDDIQKSEIPAAAQYLIEEDREITFNLPSKLDDADQETIDLYLANLTALEFKELEVSYKIENYLESINRAEEVYKDLGQTDMLTLSDLSKYISEEELADFNSFDVDSEIESRAWCSNIKTKCYYVGYFFNPLSGTNAHHYTKVTTESCCKVSWKGVKCYLKVSNSPIRAGGC